MIVPEGKRLILDPRDEYTHPPEPFSNYNESMYFNGFDAENPVGLWVRLGNRPNEGHAEMTVCVYLPDGSVGFMFRRVPITNNDRMNAGGLSFEVVEPFKHLTIAYEGEVLWLKDPAAMMDPARAFKENPKRACRIRLDVHGVSPMHGGEIVEADGSRWDLDPDKEVFRGHTEQHTAVSGELTVGDESWRIDGTGYRDKSWGPRHWQSFYHYKWAPITFGKDFGLLLSLMGNPAGAPIVVGHAFRDGRLIPITDAAVSVDYDARYFQKAIRLRLTTDEEVYDVTAETFSLIPLRHRRTLRDGSTSTARITEGMVRYTCNGRAVWGMSEFLDLLVEGDKPISVALETA